MGSVTDNKGIVASKISASLSYLVSQRRLCGSRDAYIPFNICYLSLVSVPKDFLLIFLQLLVSGTRNGCYGKELKRACCLKVYQKIRKGKDVKEPLVIQNPKPRYQVLITLRSSASQSVSSLVSFPLCLSLVSVSCTFSSIQSLWFKGVVSRESERNEVTKGNGSKE